MILVHNVDYNDKVKRVEFTGDDKKVILAFGNKKVVVTAPNWGKHITMKFDTDKRGKMNIDIHETSEVVKEREKKYKPIMKIDVDNLDQSAKELMDYLKENVKTWIHTPEALEKAELKILSVPVTLLEQIIKVEKRRLIIDIAFILRKGKNIIREIKLLSLKEFVSSDLEEGIALSKQGKLIGYARKKENKIIIIPHSEVKKLHDKYSRSLKLTDFSLFRLLLRTLTIS